MHFLHEYTLGSHIEFLLTATRVKLVNPLCIDGRIDLLVYLAIFQLFGTFPIPCEFSNIFIKGFSIFYSVSFSLGCNSRWPDALAAMNDSNCLTIYLVWPNHKAFQLSFKLPAVSTTWVTHFPLVSFHCVLAAYLLYMQETLDSLSLFHSFSVIASSPFF